MSSKKGRAKKRNDDNGQNEDKDLAEQRKLLIDAWVARDEIYRQLFGEYTYVTPANYAAPSKIVPPPPINADTTNGGSADPGSAEPEEHHLAVLAYGPEPTRPYWTYVTAGLSSPWLQDKPEEASGFACELMIKSPEDAAWPAQILRSLAYYIFNHAGIITPGVRIGLNASIVESKDSPLRNLFVWYADEAPDALYTLPSGNFGLFCIVGITDDECRYSESVDEYGTWCIQEVLRAVGVGQVSNPGRMSVINEDNAERLNNARIFANNFGADLGSSRMSQED